MAHERISRDLETQSRYDERAEMLRVERGARINLCLLRRSCARRCMGHRLEDQSRDKGLSHAARRRRDLNEADVVGGMLSGAEAKMDSAYLRGEARAAKGTGRWDSTVPLQHPRRGPEVGLDGRWPNCSDREERCAEHQNARREVGRANAPGAHACAVHGPLSILRWSPEAVLGGCIYRAERHAFSPGCTQRCQAGGCAGHELERRARAGRVHEREGLRHIT